MIKCQTVRPFRGKKILLFFKGKNTMPKNNQFTIQKYIFFV